MDIEQLKLILETVEGLGSASLDAVIWYIVLSEIPGFILGASSLYLIGFSILKIANAVRQAQEDTRLVEYLRDYLRAGSPGIVMDSEREAIKRKVRELKEFRDAS